MDIRLQPSSWLFLLRFCVVGLVVLAALSSESPELVTALLLFGSCWQVISFLSPGDPVCRINTPIDSGTEDQSRTQNIILKLRSERHIELALKAHYCLWWIQILYLSSAQRSCVVLILPDTCAADERRRLRQILNRQILHQRY